MNDSATHKDHYSDARARAYKQHHEKSLRTRITTWRERAILTGLLKQAGSPSSVLDAPCGTGRFWPAIIEAGARQIVAADNSAGMLAAAAPGWNSSTGVHLKLLNASLFALDLPDDTVDTAVCMRFFHHLARPEDRAKVLSELHRVAKTHVILSLWTDGNLKAATRSRSDKRKRESAEGYGRRIVIPRAQIEQEIHNAGFRIVAQRQAWPLLSPWRTYLIEKR